jgi:hypothetical protein
VEISHFFYKVSFPKNIGRTSANILVLVLRFLWALFKRWYLFILSTNSRLIKSYFLLKRSREEIIGVPVQPTARQCLLLCSRHKIKCHICPYQSILINGLGWKERATKKYGQRRKFYSMGTYSGCADSDRSWLKLWKRFLLQFRVARSSTNERPREEGVIWCC